MIDKDQVIHGLQVAGDAGKPPSCLQKLVGVAGGDEVHAEGALAVLVPEHVVALEPARQRIRHGRGRETAHAHEDGVARPGPRRLFDPEPVVYPPVASIGVSLVVVVVVVIVVLVVDSSLPAYAAAGYR